eukprot:scaffold65029_cov32-Tisochrysis_lutea.AAC.2
MAMHRAAGSASLRATVASASVAEVGSSAHATQSELSKSWQAAGSVAPTVGSSCAHTAAATNGGRRFGGNREASGSTSVNARE